MQKPRTILLHRFALRPNLFLGCDREMTLILLIICGALGFSTMSIRAGIVALIMWFIGLGMLRMMAKSDPYMRHIFIQYIKYSRYYRAKSTPYHVSKKDNYR